MLVSGLGFGLLSKLLHKCPKFWWRYIISTPIQTGDLFLSLLARAHHSGGRIPTFLAEACGFSLRDSPHLARCHTEQPKPGFKPWVIAHRKCLVSRLSFLQFLFDFPESFLAIDKKKACPELQCCPLQASTVALLWPYSEFTAQPLTPRLASTQPTLCHLRCSPRFSFFTLPGFQMAKALS